MTSTPDNQKNEPGAAGDKLGCGLALLVFVFPLVGLALYLVEGKTKPARARSAGLVALVGTVALLVFLGVLWVLVKQVPDNAKRVACVSHLMQLHMAVQLSAQDKTYYPDLSSPASIRKELGNYLNNPAALCCPADKKPFQGNAVLWKKKPQQIGDPSKMIAFYDAGDAHPLGRNVIYLNGQVRTLSSSEWEKAKQESGIDTAKP